MSETITILGATGSVGVNTLRVIAGHPERYRVHALTANCNAELLFEQCREFSPALAVMMDEEAAARLRVLLRDQGLATEVLTGEDALVAAASDSAVDTVMAAIVGGAGLLPTLAAARSGKKVLLANKEALVMSGSLFMDAASRNGARILPIDSEHNAIFQCLPVNGDARFVRRPGDGFVRIILTASGGPFLHHSAEQLVQVSPEQACAHPNWSMGRKISVDSATLVNKALELIEASYLFATPAEQIDILIHPQSIIHSMVQYSDGSVLAQLGNPDMRTPIAYGLAWPDRIEAGVEALDLARLSGLEFYEADTGRFPGLELGKQAAAEKGAAPIIFNAANEVAVEAFLNLQLGFTQIPVIIDKVLQGLSCGKPGDLDQILDTDQQARRMARLFLQQAA